MGDKQNPPVDPHDPEFESLIPEFPYPNPTFERVMNTPVRQPQEEEPEEEEPGVSNLVDEYFRKRNEKGLSETEDLVEDEE